MRRRILCLAMATLLLLPAASKAGNAARQEMMGIQFDLTNDIPGKTVFREFAARASRESGRPVRQMTWVFSGGSLAAGAVPGYTLPNAMRLSDARQRFASVKGQAEFGYLLYLPVGYDGEKAYPVLFFLHGIGERGENPLAIAGYGPFQYILQGHPLDMVVIAPQLESGCHWVEDSQGNEKHAQIERLKIFIRQMKAAYALDMGRMCLAGLSMGGRGAYKLACALPDAFAAIVICCGRAGVRDKPDTFVYDLSKLAGTPVWIFHGLEDATVSADHALAALRALLGINPKGDFRLTLYPGVGHESYEYAFRDPLLYAWLEVSGK